MEVEKKKKTSLANTQAAVVGVNLVRIKTFKNGNFL